MDKTAKIYFDGPSGPVAPGSTISVQVFMDTDSPVNTFDLSVNFQKEYFQFLDSDNTDSIVDIWQTKPSMEVPSQVDFSGGILDSFSGTNGSLVKLSFKVLDASRGVGEGQISLAKGDLFLSDGLGTKIVASSAPFNMSVEENAEVVSEPIIPFVPTESDILIEEGVKKIEAEASPGSIYPTLLTFALIIFVICAYALYNKTKRKL